uniref:Uncharacterized protein n=2 Tax=Panagrolaimus sp. PS1159 TaxID=55785 RepID=A0AC35GN06_9BILA
MATKDRPKHSANRKLPNNNNNVKLQYTNLGDEPENLFACEFARLKVSNGDDSGKKKLKSCLKNSFQLTKLPTRKRTVCFALNEEVVKYEAGEILSSCHSSNSDMEQPAAKRRRVEIVPEGFLYGNFPSNEKMQQPKNNNTRVQRSSSISTNQQSHILPPKMMVYKNVNSMFAFCTPFQASSPFTDQQSFHPFHQKNIQPPFPIMQQNDRANKNVFSGYQLQRTLSMRDNHYHKIQRRQSFSQQNVRTSSQHFRLYNTPSPNQMMQQNGMKYNNNYQFQLSPSNPVNQQTHRNPTQGFHPNVMNATKYTTFKFVPDPSRK